MKKTLLFVLAIFLVILGFSFIYLSIRLNMPLSIENILPGKPVLYFRLSHIDENLDELFTTKLWENLKKIDYKKMLMAAGLKESNFQKYESFSNEKAVEQFAKFLRKFFGQEVAVAAYPLPIGQVNINNLGDSFSNFIFVTRISRTAKFIEFLSATVARSNQDISFKKTEYEGHIINVITLKGKKVDIGYVRIRDLIIFGMTDKPAKYCLDVFKKKKESLSRDAAFLKIRKNYLPDTEIFGYLNLQSLFEGIRSYSKKLIALRSGKQADVLIERFDKNFRAVEGFHAAGFSGILSRMSQVKVDVHFDRKQLNPKIRSFYYCAPQENRTVQLVPKEAWGYQWNVCYDFDYHWQQALGQSWDFSPESLKEKTFLQRFSANLKQQFGLTVEEDILPTLGNEFGGYLQRVDTSGIFPLPQFLFFAEVLDQNKQEEILKLVLEQQLFMQPQKEEYKKVLIHYISIPMLTNLQPSYAYVKNYLLIASHRNLIKNSIDNTLDSSQSLKADEAFGSIGIGLQEKNNAIYYLKLDEIVDAAKELIGWWNQWSSMQISKYEAFQEGGEKRLEDLKKNIDKQREEIKNLRSELENLEKSKSDAPPLVEQDEIQRKQKFIIAFEDSIIEAKKEQQELIEARDADVKRITPEGEKRLLELGPLLARREERLKTLKEEFEELKIQAQQALGREERIALIREQIAQTSISLESDQEAAEEVEKMIEGYENPEGLTMEAKRVLVNDVVQPCLGALSAFKIFASKIFIGDNLLEAFLYLKVE